MTFGDRKTPMRRTEFKRKPGAKGLERTELKRGTKPMPKTGRKSKADQASLRKSKPIVADRSGGYCEFRIPGVCTGEAVHYHHRQTGHANHDPEAIAHVCDACHDHAHLRSGPATDGHSRNMAYQMGWLVEHPTDPASVPVLRMTA